MTKDASDSKRKLRSLGVALLVVAYLLLRPGFERHFGGRQVPPVADVPDDQLAPQRPSAGESSDRGKQAVVNRDDSRDPDGDSPPLRQPVRLTEITPNLFESTAGLRYGPGSREGHRLKHVLLHGRDQPNRRGSHGVFDGDRETILALLDEAFQMAQERGPPVRKQVQGPRTVYTVDMNRRVGYVGGQNGRRNNHPACRHVRLVLEGRNVITAFPLVP